MKEFLSFGGLGDVWNMLQGMLGFSQKVQWYFSMQITIPRYPITLSEDDWGVQSPPQGIFRFHFTPFQKINWILREWKHSFRNVRTSTVRLPKEMYRYKYLQQPINRRSVDPPLGIKPAPSSGKKKETHSPPNSEPLQIFLIRNQLRLNLVVGSVEVFL